MGVLAAGCQKQQPAQSDTPPTAGVPATKSSPPVTPTAPRYTGPAVSLQILQLESFPVQHVAAVEVETPTGGWTLKRDDVTIENDTVKLYYTLERPGEGEMVTQALVTLRDRYVNTEKALSHAEVHIHLAQRGVHTFATNYVLAAKK